MINGQAIKLFADAHVFDGEYQGSRTFIKELYNQLALNEDLHLYLGGHNIDNLRSCFPERENISYIKYKTKSSILRLLFEIPAIIKKYGIEYAHFQYIIPIYKNCRVIVTMHDVIFNEVPGSYSSWYRFQKNILYRRSAKKADILTTVSEFSKQSIKKYFRIPDKKINVMQHGVNRVFFQPYNKKESADFISNKYGLHKTILCVSRFEPRKNQVLLLQAFIDLQLYKQDYHLVLLGHKTLAIPAFDTLLNSLQEDIRRYIFISDKISDEELLQFYKAATVFVYPSQAEGFGMPPLEAAALKIPVLCSNSSSLAEFKFFGINHVNTSVYQAFKERLLSLLTRPQDENELIKIQKHIQTNYCWNKTVTSFYHLILQNKGYDKL